MTNQFLNLVFKASWQGAVIIVLVLAAQYALGRRLNPRWRHALWWLVLARLALPATFSTPASVFNLIPFSHEAARVADADLASDFPPIAPNSEDESLDFNASPETGRSVSPYLWLWAAGALFMAARLGINHFRLHQSVTRRRPLIDDGVLNLLEDCKQHLGLRTPVALVETAAVDGPCLFGFIRPRLLLPAGFTRDFSRDELRFVFLHELGHVKRNDIMLGWLMALLQIAHWFNPLVWLAFSRARVDRELACDALVLSHAGEREHKPYGRAIVKLLENFSGSVRAPSLAGIVEDKKQMKERILMIAKFHKSNRGAAAAACLLAALGVMTLTDAQPSADSSPASGPPHITATTPKNEATDVSPTLKEITVTFDRDMEDGMSWTGGGPNYPKSPEGAKARWKDKRTCVLPVELQPGHYYRVGINSPSFQNFRGLDGHAVTPRAISFRTSGTPVLTKAPKIVKFDPPNGAKDVNPGTKELRVTFNVPMGEGCSWCGDGPNFPTMVEGQKPRWTDGGKTCVLPVELKPGGNYELGLNSQSFKNFKSEEGVPLTPVVYTFTTSDKP